MQRHYIIAATIIATLFGQACGEPSVKDGSGTVIDTDNNQVPDAGGGDAGTPDASITVVSGAVTIAADVAIEVSSAGDARAAFGNIIVVVPVEIANGLEEPISAAFSAFRLRVEQLERLPAEGSATLEGVCPVDALLAAGATLQCSVAFEIPEASAPEAIIFEAPTGTVEDALTLQPCTKCEGRCTDLQVSRFNCGRCGNELSEGVECVDGVPSCPDGRYLCNGYCERESTTCFLQSDVRSSCAMLCGQQQLQCEQVAYYYLCDESSAESLPGATCDTLPPPTMDGCGQFLDQDCRCLP